jgi:hypothetical protein
MSKRCPKSPTLIQEQIEARVEAFTLDKKKRTVLIRSRLERLYRDLNSDTAIPDDVELSRVFKAFYTMYVWDGTGRKAPYKPIVDGESSVSIHAVSGGLPSLGKHAK